MGPGQRVLYEAGWASITLPVEAGGRGLGSIEQIIWNQELARIGAGESLFAIGLGMAAPTILAHADEPTRQRHIRKILSGEEVWCQRFSEPGDSKTPGIEVRPLRDRTGATHFNEVFLSDVRIPDSRRLGPVGGGWKVTMTTLMNERMAMGGLDRLFSLDDLLQLARDHPDRVDGVVRNQLGELCGWMKSQELLNASVITKLGRGVIPEAESSVMKLAIARILSASVDIALRLLGQYLLAPCFRIADGTDEIQKNVAAERVLGLPVEARSDREVPFESLVRS